MPIDPSAYSFLRVSVEDGIATIMMDRGSRMNACDEDGHREFGRILRDIAADPDVRVGMLVGDGPAFSVGATYEYMQALTEDRALLDDLQEQVRELVRAHIDNDKPMVAAVHGVATGSGLMFALLSDWIVVEEHVRLADGHIRAGLAAGDGGVLIWPLTVGLTRAKRYLMTGDWIDAAEAERIGLVTEVVPTGTSRARAEEVARRFAAMPAPAVRSTKRALNQWLSAGMQNGFDYSVALEVQSFSRDAGDVREAVGRIRDKNPADWW
jgi:enoyl-CoA hydratase